MAKISRLILLLVIILCFISIRAYADDTFLGGYGKMNENYPGADVSQASWKAFRFQAQASGTVDYFRVYIKNYSGNRTSDLVMVALYEDDNDAVGDLKCYAYYPSYDYTTLGPDTYHRWDVTNVEAAGDSVTSGNWYWITFITEVPEGDIGMERGGGAPDCLEGSSKRGCTTSSYPIGSTPPPGGSDVWSLIFNDDCYGQAIFDADGEDNVPPEAPRNLRIID